MGADSEHWAEYYEVTVERPAWQTVRRAIEGFRADDEAVSLAAHGSTVPAATQLPRFAVDLGCGAGRDTRELLRAGWRVLAVDREPAAATALEAAVEPDLRQRLQIHIEDLASVAIPPCDLVNASLCLPFLAEPAYEETWGRIVAALAPGRRLAAMLFGDRDESAPDKGMTCLPSERIMASLDDFEIEFWSEKEEDSQTALGDPHHFHLIELVARKTR
jgi:SAM-dependent methyltransferase